MRGERFSTTEEIQAALSPVCAGEGGGSVLHVDDGVKYCFTEPTHSLLIGGTGCGKTRTGAGTISQVLSLLEASEVVISIDPKSEIFKATSGFAKKEGYRIFTVDFRHFKGSRWNPLALPKVLWENGEKGKAQQMIQELVFGLTANEESHDRFWINMKRSTVNGLLNLLVETVPLEQCHLATALSMLEEDWESLEKDSDYSSHSTVRGGLLSKVVDTLPHTSSAKKLLANYVNLSALTTKNSVKTDTTACLAKFCTTDEAINMISGDDINISELDVDSKFIFYVIISDDSDIYNYLSGILMSQLAQHIVRLADTKYDGRLPERVNILCEEAGNVRISNLPFLLTAGRSRNIRMTLVLQALSQLDYYGSNATSILSCCDVWICFRTNDYQTLETISKRLGSKRIKAGDISFMQPLLNEVQIGAMDTGQALILIKGRIKYVEQFADFTELFDCKDLKPVKLSKIKQNENNRPIKLANLRNHIATASKTSTSRYKRESSEVADLSGFKFDFSVTADTKDDDDEDPFRDLDEIFAKYSGNIDSEDEHFRDLDKIFASRAKKEAKTFKFLDKFLKENNEPDNPFFELKEIYEKSGDSGFIELPLDLHKQLIEYLDGMDGGNDDNNFSDKPVRPVNLAKEHAKKVVIEVEKSLSDKKLFKRKRKENDDE
jgi:hypothetical protein